MTGRVFIELKHKYSSMCELEAELDEEYETIDITVYSAETGSCELSYTSARILANWILANIPIGGKDAE